MTETEELVRPATSHGVGDGPPLRHIARMGERRWDHCVETLCGLIRTVKPPRPNAVPCEACVEVRKFISGLDAL